MAKSSGGSTFTVLLAMSANVGVGLAKLVAGLLTGSGAMLSESAHSLGDTVTEVMLLAALRRSARPADTEHPFGHGKERYFWSLLAAVSIFASGALFSLYQGVSTIVGHRVPEKDTTIAFVVLAVAFVLEGTSLARATRQVRRERRREEQDLRTFVRRTDDPTVTTVLFEDSAAIVGLLLAFAGLGLTHLTGSPVWDGAASLAIGVLLIVVAYGLGRINLDLLVGRQADPRFVRGISERIGAQPEVEAVVDLITMLIGADRVLLCARLDFVDGIDSDDVERASVRIDQELRDEFPELVEVFLAAVPRGDPATRERVRARDAQ